MRRGSPNCRSRNSEGCGGKDHPKRAWCHARDRRQRQHALKVEKQEAEGEAGWWSACASSRAETRTFLGLRWSLFRPSQQCRINGVIFVQMSVPCRSNRPPKAKKAWVITSKSTQADFPVALASSALTISLQTRSTSLRDERSLARTKWNSPAGHISLHSAIIVFAATSFRPTMYTRRPEPEVPCVDARARTAYSPIPEVPPTNTAVTDCLLTSALLQAWTTSSCTIIIGPGLRWWWERGDTVQREYLSTNRYTGGEILCIQNSKCGGKSRQRLPLSSPDLVTIMLDFSFSSLKCPKAYIQSHKGR